MRRLAALCHPILFLAASPAVNAGRPLSTEDASHLADKACQVEAWIDRSSEQAQGWFVPACNFGLGIEWQLGFSRASSATEAGSRFPETYLQAKTAWTLPVKSWAVGTVIGVTRHRARDDEFGSNPYILIPLSHVVDAAGTTVHANLGWSRGGPADVNRTLWGLAVEHPLPSGLTLLAETFGDDRGNPFFRAGGRYAAIRNRLDLDLSYVLRSGGDRAERFISIGFHWQADPFLP